MITKAVISTDRTQVTFYFTNKGSFTLQSSDGKVVELLEWFFTPTTITFGKFKNAQELAAEDTQWIKVA